MTPDTIPLLDIQAALHDTWRRLMGPLGFSRRSLWFFLIGPDHRMASPITQVEDLPSRPSPRDQESLAHLLGHLAEAGHRVAFLVSRPGRDGLSAGDRCWAAALGAACREAGVVHEMVHRANDVDLVPVTLDDLPSGASRLR